MPLYQGLELRLDIGSVGIRFKPENIERAALRIENLAALRHRVRMTGAPSPPFTKQGEGIVGRPVLVTKAFCRLAGSFAADRTPVPGRAVPGRGPLRIFRY